MHSIKLKNRILFYCFTTSQFTKFAVKECINQTLLSLLETQLRQDLSTNTRSKAQRMVDGNIKILWIIPFLQLLFFAILHYFSEVWRDPKKVFELTSLLKKFFLSLRRKFVSQVEIYLIKTIRQENTKQDMFWRARTRILFTPFHLIINQCFVQEFYISEGWAEAASVAAQRGAARCDGPAEPRPRAHHSCVPAPAWSASWCCCRPYWPPSPPPRPRHPHLTNSNKSQGSLRHLGGYH